MRRHETTTSTHRGKCLCLVTKYGRPVGASHIPYCYEEVGLISGQSQGTATASGVTNTIECGL